jgi:hypothetical protein
MKRVKTLVKLDFKKVNPDKLIAAECAINARKLIISCLAKIN